MPIVIVHDSGVGNEVGLAANVGAYQTGQDAYQNALHADANRRANAAQAFQQQEQLSSGDESAYRTILSDLTQRQLSSDRLQNQQDLLGQRLQGNLDTTIQRGSDAMDRTQLTTQTRSDIANADRQSREETAAAANKLKQALFDGGDQTKRDINDMKIGLGYDHLQTLRDLAAEKDQAIQEREQAKTAEQRQRAQDQLNAASQRMQIHAMITDQMAQRRSALSTLQTNAKISYKPVSPDQVQQVSAPFDEKIRKLAEAMTSGQQASQPQVNDLSGMIAPQGFDPSSYLAGGQGMAATDLSGMLDQGPGLEGPAPVAPPASAGPQLDPNAPVGRIARVKDQQGNVVQVWQMTQRGWTQVQ